MSLILSKMSMLPPTIHQSPSWQLCRCSIYWWDMIQCAHTHTHPYPYVVILYREPWAMSENVVTWRNVLFLVPLTKRRKLSLSLSLFFFINHIVSIVIVNSIWCKCIHVRSSLRWYTNTFTYRNCSILYIKAFRIRSTIVLGLDASFIQSTSIEWCYLYKIHWNVSKLHKVFPTNHFIIFWKWNLLFKFTKREASCAMYCNMSDSFDAIYAFDTIHSVRTFC